MSELHTYDREGRKAFKSKADVWFARWILEQPDDKPVYAQQFRHEMIDTLRPAGIAMPDINQSIRRFRDRGMLVSVDNSDIPHAAHSAEYHLPVHHDGWEPFAQFFAEHIELHHEEFAIQDAAVDLEV